MKCNKCGKELETSKVIEKPEDKHCDVIRRQYQCHTCKSSYETIEKKVVPIYKIYILKLDDCVEFSRQYYKESLLEALEDESNAEAIADDIINAWYLYALQNSNATIKGEEDIKELRIAYTIDDLVSFTVRTLYSRGLAEASKNYLNLCILSFVKIGMYRKLLDEISNEKEGVN